MADSKPNVLIVDDDSDLLYMLSAAMQAFGFNTLLAKDGVEGVDKFREAEPELVISDIYMPRKNGLLMLEEIRSLEVDTVIILITGFHHYNQLLQHSKSPPNGFLPKPFNLHDLMAAIRNACLALEGTSDVALKILEHIDTTLTEGKQLD